jgi:hypothetical protein
MNKFFVFIFCFSMMTVGYTQTSSKAYVQQQLDSLHRYGAVIVLLKGNTRAMEAYQKAGQSKVVEEITKKNNKINQLLIHAFTYQWRYCPVYFMMNDDIATLQSNPQSAVFVDSQLHHNPSIILPKDYFVFMDFGTYYVPSVNESNSKSSDWKSKNNTTHNPTESNETVEECLIVKDRNLNQFLPPYPRRSVSIMGSRDMEAIVAALNKRFTEYAAENK